MKTRCRLMPPVLKSQISRLIDLERCDCKSDDVAFFDLILKHAIVPQPFQRTSQEYAAKADTKSAKADRKPQRSSGDKTSAPRVTTPAVTPSDGKGGSAFFALCTTPPRDGCLVGKRPHWLNDCPAATEA
ncbi:LOW QUALITY PROTEIN: hypothetical protein PHMEG_00010054 [Phytophthora megakarya]|uniref:Uncharacterized protein n=1 Tax=Phytophthora megakarya TaxID=4795 RepID=A0A225WF78_9STRA|nr:LOW QUALITY PROTEIN: hypothetical protein PHMEG_00010054 [Phytophthora megakarya]